MRQFLLGIALLWLFFSCEKGDNLYEHSYLYGRPVFVEGVVPDSSGGFFVLLSEVKEEMEGGAYALSHFDREGHHIYDLRFEQGQRLLLAATAAGGCLYSVEVPDSGICEVQRLLSNGRSLWQQRLALDSGWTVAQIQETEAGEVVLSVEAQMISDGPAFRYGAWTFDAAGKKVNHWVTDTLRDFFATHLHPEGDGNYLLQGVQTSESQDGNVQWERHVLVELGPEGRTLRTWTEKDKRHGMFTARGILNPSGHLMLSMLALNDTISKDRLSLQLIDSKTLQVSAQAEVPTEIYAPPALAIADDGGYYVLGGKGFNMFGPSPDQLWLYRLGSDLKVKWVSTYGEKESINPYYLDRFPNGDLMLAAQLSFPQAGFVLIRADAEGKEVPKAQKIRLQFPEN